jgi:phosphohistidine phosphatase
MGARASTYPSWARSLHPVREDIARAGHDADVSDSTDAPAGPRRLVLVRHAKAVSDAGGSDQARELSGQGRKDAATVGGWLTGRLSSVDAAWSSSAVRARQTFEAIAERLTFPVRVDLRDDLYDAGPDDLLELVREADDGVVVLMVVGHNPTIERLQAWLSEDDRGFPAGAAAIVEFDGSWADLSPGAARLVAFTVP